MRRVSIVGTVVAFLALVPNAFAAGPFGTIHAGYWQGGAYTDDNTGAFSHCSAAAGFASGTSLFVGQNAQRLWLFGFSNPAWNIAQGQTFKIDLTFDGQAQFHVFGTGVVAAAGKLVSGILPAPAANVLRRSHLMVATSGQTTVQFDLKYVDQVVPMVAHCVERMKASGVAGAGDFSVTPPKPPIATAAAKSTIVDTAQPAQQKLTIVTGTGFVVSNAGHIVTNNHVISECVGDIHGNLVGEGSSTLRVVSTDETNDLALLQATGMFKDIASIRATAVHSGDPVIAIGFPFHGLLTSDFTVTNGIINSLAGLFNDTRVLQISAPVQPGNSGGPLLDTTGSVIGVVAEKLNALKIAKATGDLPENVNFAIKTGALRDFLDNSVVPYRISQQTTEMKTADITSGARAYTMLVSCSAPEGAGGKK